MAGRKKGSTTVGDQGRRVGRQINLLDSEWEELKQEAESRGLSKAALVRLALKDFYRRHPVPKLEE